MTFIKKNYKILIIVLTIVIFILFLLSIKTNPKVLKCSIDKDLVSGIHLTDNIKINLNKGKIKNIKQDKSIELKDDYLKYDTYKSIMEMHLKSSYEYLDKKNYDVKIYTIHFFKFIEDCFMLISLCQDKEAKKVCSKLIGYIYDKNKHQEELDAHILNKDQFLLYPIQKKYYDILENWNNMTQLQKLRVKLNTKRHF